MIFGGTKIRLEATPSTQLRRDPQGWNRRLSRKFALAPTDLVKRGKVNEKNYETECRRVGELGSRAIINQLGGRLVMVLGIGLCRDWGFVEEANRQEVSVAACDWSKVAQKNGEEFFEKLPRGSRVWNRVRRVDVEVLLENLFTPVPHKKKTYAQRDLEEADLVYGGQFIQVLDNVGKGIVMRGLGKWLVSRPGRKVVLVHPFPEDNKDREWGYTTPYSLEELIRPANAGAGRELNILNLDNKGGFLSSRLYRSHYGVMWPSNQRGPSSPIFLKII